MHQEREAGSQGQVTRISCANMRLTIKSHERREAFEFCVVLPVSGRKLLKRDWLPEQGRHISGEGHIPNHKGADPELPLGLKLEIALPRCLPLWVLILAEDRVSLNALQTLEIKGAATTRSHAPRPKLQHHEPILSRGKAHNDFGRGVRIAYINN